LWGNMAIAVSIDSPSVAWRSLARQRMVVVVSCEGSNALGRWILAEWNRESNRERVMAFARKVEVQESTAALDFHSFWGVFRDRVLVHRDSREFGERGAMAAVVKIGSRRAPRIPLWSRKAVGRV